MPKLDLLERELKRKAIHICGSLIPILYIFTQWEVAVLILSSCFPIALAVEWHRLKYGWSFSFIRSHEKQKISAALYFAFSSLFTVFFFEKAIAIAALLMLAIGDTVSGIAGAAFQIKGSDVRHSETSGSGNSNLKIKPVELFGITFVICFFLGYLFLPLKAALAGAFVAALADSVALDLHGEVLDDNLTIPVLSGVAMSLASLL